MEEHASKEIWQEIQNKSEKLGLYSSSNVVKRWWIEFETFNQDYPEEVLNILNVLETYEASLHELWLCYTFSLDQEVSVVLDYLILKKTNQDEDRPLVTSDFVDSIGMPLLLH